MYRLLRLSAVNGKNSSGKCECGKRRSRGAVDGGIYRSGRLKDLQNVVCFTNDVKQTAGCQNS